MSTPPLSRRTLLRGTMAAGVAASFVPLAVRPVFAEVAANATTGYLTLNRSTVLVRANADGSGVINLNHPVKSNVPWTVDGSRFAYTHTGTSGPNTAGIWTRRPDGSHPTQVTRSVPELGWDSSQDQDLAFSAAGRFIYFSRFGQIMAVTADGNWLRDDLIDYSSMTPGDRHPHIAIGQSLIFDRRVNNTGAPGIYRYVSATQATLLIPNAKCGRYSPDGTKIAYVTSDTNYGGGELWVANSDGTGGAKLAGPYTGLSELSWTPDGTAIYFTVDSQFGGDVHKVVVSGGAVTHITAGAGAGLQPVTSEENFIVRTWGQLALDTAIAISQFNWANHNAPTNPDDQSRFKAGAVVVGRGDQFYDALAGSALAANKDAPLLITPPNSLYGPAQAELQRVLAPGGTVYLLGGPVAISTAIETTIKNLGYVTVRCGGFDMFDTAVKINQQITSDPQIIIIATGAEFYDALAAGAAAGAYDDAVVVLTDGTRMPNFSANYLNSINPVGKTIITAGGPGEDALLNGLFGNQIPNWFNNEDWGYYSLVGADAIETALLLAGFMFSGPQIAAVATAAGWYDALTGGAMVGNNYGPLLLTPPGNLDSRVAAYLNDNSSNISYAVVLGGTAALPAARVPQIGENIGLAGAYVYDEVTPGSSAAAARKGTDAKKLELKVDQITTGVKAFTASGRPKQKLTISSDAKLKRPTR